MSIQKQEKQEILIKSLTNSTNLTEKEELLKQIKNNLIGNYSNKQFYFEYLNLFTSFLQVDFLQKETIMIPFLL